MCSIFALLVVIAICQANQLACNQQYQCNIVSDNYNYVQCLNNVCACRTDLGFAGNATASFKCSCPEPYAVSWQYSIPYCIRFDDAVSYKQDEAREAFLESVVSKVYTNLVWPRPVSVMQAVIAGVPSHISDLFVFNAKGRVDPLGTYTNPTDLIEYFYGTIWTGAARVHTVTFKKLVAQDNLVAVNVKMDFSIYDQTQQNIAYNFSLVQSGTFTFNDNDLISSVDVVVRNLVASPGGLGVEKNAPGIQLVCNIILYAAQCTSVHDPNGYYVNMADCINHFTNVFPWGTRADQWAGQANSTACRFTHSILAIGRPAVHCSNVGKTGGDKCVSKPYTSYFEVDY